MDVSTLAVQVKSDGIKETTDALLALALAADKANNSSDNLSKKSDEVATSTDDAAKKTSGYTARLEERALALGKNVEQTATAIAQYRALSEVDQSRAEKAGRDIDQFKEKTAMYQGMFDALEQQTREYAKLQAGIDAYYASLDRAQAKGKSLNETGSRTEEYKKLASAQAEAIRMNNAMIASEANLEKQMRGAAIEDRSRSLKNLGAAQSEAIAMDKAMTAAQDATKASNDKWLASLVATTGAYGKTGKELQNYRADLVAAEAASRGLTAQAASHVQSMRDIDTATKGAHGSTSGIVREMIVLGHEMLQGNFSRFGGSLVVMAERLNVVKYVTAAWASALEIVGGTALVAAGAIATILIGLAALAAVIYKTTQNAKEFKTLQNDLILTGQFAGATADSMREMGIAIGTANGSISEANKTVMELSKTGKFTAGQIGMITESVVSLSHAAGVPIEDTIKAFESLSKGVEASTIKSTLAVSKNAAELNDQYHYMTADTFARIKELEHEGDSYGALSLSVKTFADANKIRVAEIEANMTSSMRRMKEWKQAISNWWAEIGQVQTDGSKRQDLIGQMNFVGKKDGKLSPEYQKAVQDLANFDEVMTIKSANVAYAANEAEKNRVKIHGQEIFDLMTKQNDKKYAATIKLAEYRSAFYAQDESFQLTHQKEFLETQLKLETDQAGKVAKIRSAGTTGVNADVSAIESEYNMKKNDAENQLKLADYLHKNLMLDDKSYADFRGAVLDQMTFDLISSEQKEINIREAFHGKTAAEINNNAKAIVMLEAKKYKDLGSLQTKDLENDLANQGAANKALNAQSKADETVVANIEKKTRQLQLQNAAYLALPDSVRQAGTTEKQMQDYITQASIDSNLAEMASITALGDLQTAADRLRLEDLGKLVIAERAFKVEQTLRESQIALDAAHLAQTAADKTTTAAYQMEAAFKKAFKGMEDALVNFVMTGKLDFKGLVDSMLKDLLRIQLTEFFKSSGITDGLKNMFTSSGSFFQSSGGGSGSGGMPGSSGGSGGFNVSSLFSSSSSGLADGATNAAVKGANLLMSSGNETAQAAGNWLGSNAASIGENVSNGASFISYADALYNLSKGKIATAIGEAAGTYFGGPIGGAIGKAVGGWIDKQFQGEMRYGGAYSYTQKGGVVKDQGPSGGDIALPQVSAAIKSSADGLQATLAALGSKAAVTGFTAGLESSKNGKAFTFAGGSVNGQQFGTNRDARVGMGSATPEQALAQFQIDLKRATLEGLQAAHIGGYIDQYLNQLGNLKSLTSEQADAAITTINNITGLVQALKLLPVQFNSLKNASVDSAIAIATMTGGMNALGTKLASYFNNFYTTGEKSANTLSKISEELNKVGVQLPATRDDFRNLVDGLQNLSDATSQEKYAALMNVADAFASVIPAAAGATTATANITSATSALTSAYQTQKSALDSTISSMKTFAQGVRTFKDGLLLGNLSTLTPEQKYAASKSAFNTTLGAANKGDTIAQGQLQNAATAFLTASQAVNASSDIYTKDFDFIQKSLGDTAVYADSQVQIAQDSLVALDAQVAGLITVNASVLTVTQAINNLRLAGGGTPTASTGMLQVNGSHANGLNSVPFNGYIAQLHKGEQVLTAPEASNYKAGGNMQPLVNEIKSLHDEIRNLRNDQAAQTRDLMVSNMAANDAAAKQIVQGSVKAAETQNWKTSTMKKAAII